MADVPQWFSNPIKANDLFRGDFYICTNCGGQSSGGIYSSVCTQCNGIQSDPPRSARLKYLCNTCARSPICKCDYPVAPRALTAATPPPRPKSPHPCCCSCTWCKFLCRCICCCLKCSWKSSSCKSCCTSQWNCRCCTCYWSWCGCSCSQPSE